LLTDGKTIPPGLVPGWRVEVSKDEIVSGLGGYKRMPTEGVREATFVGTNPRESSALVRPQQKRAKK
jgi:hypothetical protein